MRNEPVDEELVFELAVANSFASKEMGAAPSVPYMYVKRIRARPLKIDVHS